jgi:hypothetical protein
LANALRSQLGVFGPQLVPTGMGVQESLLHKIGRIDMRMPALVELQTRQQQQI